MSDEPEAPPTVQYQTGEEVPEQFRSAPRRGKPGTGEVVFYRRASTMPTQPGFRLETIGSAWSLVLKHPGIWFLNGLPLTIMFGSYVAAQLYLTEAFSKTYLLKFDPRYLELASLRFGTDFALWFAVLLYVNASHRMALKQVDGEEIRVADTFSFGGRALESIGFAVVFGLVLGFIHMQFVLGSLLILPFLSLVPGLLQDRKISFMEAVRESGRLASPNYAGAIAVWALLLTQAVLSFGLLGIGLALTAPVIAVALAITYRTYDPISEPVKNANS